MCLSILKATHTHTRRKRAQQLPASAAAAAAAHHELQAADLAAVHAGALEH